MPDKTNELKTYIKVTETQKEQLTRKWVNDNFSIMWENSRATYEQFGGKTLQRYLDNGRKAINVLNKPRVDGRSNVKSVTPLNKLKAILARVALNRPDIRVQAENKAGDIDVNRGLVLKDLYKWSYDNIQEEESADTEYFFKGFDCQIDGTFISYEGYDGQTHTQKKILDYDMETGEVKWEEEEYQTDQCFSQHIKPEDFFIWNPYMRSLQKQPRVAWRTVYDKAIFDYEFRNYKKAKYVMTRSMTNEFDLDDKYFERLRDRVTNDQVEVLRMYDRFLDRLVIIANGIVLQDTPMYMNNGKPKKYPFAKTISSPFAGGEFFWGMHLWHILEGDVSALETLFNLGIEQSKLNVNPPYLTTSGNEIEDNALLAGRVLEVDDPQNFRELQFTPPGQSYFNMIEKIGQNIDFSSVDPVGSGQNVPNTTARGQVIAEENARRLLSLFNMMMENLVLQEAKLRIPNIIQFQVIPGAKFRVNDTSVDNENGVREIEVVGSMKDAKDRKLIDMLEDIAEINGIKLQNLQITPAWLDSIKYNIEVVSESSFQQGKSIAVALELEKIGAVSKLFPNIFQSASEMFFKSLIEKYEDNPEKYLDAMRQSAGAGQQLLMQRQQGNMGGNIVQELTGNKDLSLNKLNGVE